MGNLLRIKNGQVIKRSAIPKVSFREFSDLLVEFVNDDGYVVHCFAYLEEGRNHLLAVVRKAHLYVLATEVGEEFLSLTASGCAKFHLFEREIAEQYGLRPLDHPWLKPVRYHANQRLVPDIFDNDYNVDIPGNYPYYRIEGEGVHEVGVGPVHAGIIEPGHFRFQCAGEEVLSLEIQLGYQHRGVERLLSTVPLSRLTVLCEAIAGDTAIGHNLCCCQALESLADLEVTDGAKLVRSLALELERLANHVGDLGALSGDVAFNPPAAYFGRMRGEFLNLLLLLSGNRFGKSLVVPGGISRPMRKEQGRTVKEKLGELSGQLAHVADLLFSAHTVQARFEQTGTVTLQTAKALGLVGCCARASGLDYDARLLFPTEAYGAMSACRNHHVAGDVYSRAWVRHEEVHHSLGLIDQFLERLDGSDMSRGEEELWLQPDAMVVTINEAWRGEVSHCLLTDGKGRICRYKVKDPSFHNWAGLAMALRNEEISDFPLCNKSFNLSYCGFDL